MAKAIEIPLDKPGLELNVLTVVKKSIKIIDIPKRPCSLIKREYSVCECFLLPEIWILYFLDSPGPRPKIGFSRNALNSLAIRNSLLERSVSKYLSDNVPPERSSILGIM